MCFESQPKTARALKIEVSMKDTDVLKEIAELLKEVRDKTADPETAKMIDERLTTILDKNEQKNG